MRCQGRVARVGGERRRVSHCYRARITTHIYEEAAGEPAVDRGMDKNFAQTSLLTWSQPEPAPPFKQGLTPGAAHRARGPTGACL